MIRICVIALCFWVMVGRSCADAQCGNALAQPLRADAMLQVRTNRSTQTGPAGEFGPLSSSSWGTENIHCPETDVMSNLVKTRAQDAVKVCTEGSSCRCSVTWSGKIRTYNRRRRYNKHLTYDLSAEGGSSCNTGAQIKVHVCAGMCGRRRQSVRVEDRKNKEPTCSCQLTQKLTCESDMSLRRNPVSSFTGDSSSPSSSSSSFGGCTDTYWVTGITCDDPDSP